MPMYDFRCTACEAVFEDIVKSDAPAPACPSCAGDAERLLAVPHTFSTIVPDYPGSKKLKAGYVHSHGDRPATKIQVTVPRG